MARLKAGEILPKDFMSKVSNVANQNIYNTFFHIGSFSRIAGADDNGDDELQDVGAFITDKTKNVNKRHYFTQLYVSTENKTPNNFWFDIYFEDGVHITSANSNSNSWSVNTDEGTLYFFRVTRIIKIDTTEKALFTVNVRQWKKLKDSITSYQNFSNFVFYYNTRKDRNKTLFSVSGTDLINTGVLKQAHNYIKCDRSCRLPHSFRPSDLYKTEYAVYCLKGVDLSNYDVLRIHPDGNYVTTADLSYVYFDGDSYVLIKYNVWKFLSEVNASYHTSLYLNTYPDMNLHHPDDEVSYYVTAKGIDSIKDNFEINDSITYEYSNQLNTRDVNQPYIFAKNNNVKYLLSRFLNLYLDSFHTTSRYTFKQIDGLGEEIDFFEGDNAFGKALPMSNLRFQIYNHTTQHYLITI